jgi:lysophospholipase L1-like esterase
MSTPPQTGNGKRLLITLTILVIAGLTVTFYMRPTAITIVAFGDSTTDRRDTVEAVYADRLPALLMPKGFRATVINAGMGGSHTGHRKDHDLFKVPHARDRFRSAVMEYQPDLVIIQFGANDGWVDGDSPDAPSRIRLDTYKANLTYLMGKISEGGAKIILMTPNKIGAPHEPWRNERMRRYAETLKALGAETHTPVIDLWDLPDAEVDAHLLDGTHPNDRGHAYVAGLLAERIPDVMQGKDRPL